jgi:hypothetical protein
LVAGLDESRWFDKIAGSDFKRTKCDPKGVGQDVWSNPLVPGKPSFTGYYLTSLSIQVYFQTRRLPAENVAYLFEYDHLSM